MLKGTILAGILLLPGQCLPHDDGGSPAPAEVQPACPTTTWSGWDEIPDCDLNGPQTWIWSDEQTDLEWVGNLRSYCHDAGGVYAYDNYDPATHYCIDIDY